MHRIHRSLSKSLPLDNPVILLGANVLFSDSCSGNSDGFTIVVVEMMEELGDRAAHPAYLFPNQYPNKKTISI